MKEQPLVTVLMPCYNAMPYLPEAIESIINQTYTNLEILCINDGSTDNTGEILEKYAQNDKRIRVVHNEKNIKLIATLNKGVELANGKYIARMDADDISLPNRIEYCINKLENDNSIDLISPLTENITEQNTFINRNVARNKGRLSSLFASFLFAPIGHPEILCKASLLKKNKYSNDVRVLHTEDYELWARLLQNNYSLIVDSEVLMCVRINSQSVSRKYTELQDANFVFQANQFYNRYTNKELSINLSKVITNRVNKSISIKEFVHAIKELKWFKIFFLNKENVTNSADLQEINTVYKTHLFDICFQSLKKGSIQLKIYSFPFLLYYTTVAFLDKEGRTYLMNKRKR